MNPNKYNCVNCDQLEDCIGACPKLQKPSVTIDGFVARDKFENTLCLYTSKPCRNEDNDQWHTEKWFIVLPTNPFPDLKWTDEPLAVTIQITEK